MRLPLIYFFSMLEKVRVQEANGYVLQQYCRIGSGQDSGKHRPCAQPFETVASTSIYSKTSQSFESRIRRCPRKARTRQSLETLTPPLGRTRNRSNLAGIHSAMAA